MSKAYASTQGPESKENLERYAAYQKWVFGATFMNYAMAHWTRK
jgi:hypothetical protein